MKNVFCLYKPVGETPLETIKKFKAKNTSFEKKTVSFAGRLDPMAEGLLLILVGAENKKRKEYETLEKTYSFSILFGITTDSYDLLGIPTMKHSKPLTEYHNEMLDKYLRLLKGAHKQPYPPYSSKTVNGKPLYYWARKGAINTITIPAKQISITGVKSLSKRNITLEEVVGKISAVIPHIKGEFRQEIILPAWKKLLMEYPTTSLTLYDFSITCSSGTYVRSIAHEAGAHLGVGGLAFSIERTAIGPYTLKDAKQM